MRHLFVRTIHLVMALYLTASGIEMLDRSGLADGQPVVNETAETLRQVRSGDDPLGVMDDARKAIDALRQMQDAFDQAGDALS